MSKIVKVADIKWGERARKDYGDVTGLSESIQQHGLLHPIVVDSSLTLCAGGRRLSAVTLLGWEEVTVTELGELTALQLKEIELEENIARKDFTWHEEIDLKQRIHELKGTIHGENWSTEDTAEILGESARNTSRDLALAKAIEKYPELKQEKDKNVARSKARRFQEAEMRKAFNESSSVDVSTRVDSVDGLSRGSCLDLIKLIPDDSIDLILSDPPFGIGFDEVERNQHYSTTYGEFADNLKNVENDLEKLIPHLKRVLKPGGHLYMFHGAQYYEKVHFWLKLTFGNDIMDYPLLWIKSSQENKRPYDRFAMNYETFQFCWKGKSDLRRLNKPHNCTFHYDAIKKNGRNHPAQKPVQLYKDLIEISTIEGETVLDTHLGSGISLATASVLKRKIIGFELHDEWFELSKYNLAHKEEIYNEAIETEVEDSNSNPK